MLSRLSSWCQSIVSYVIIGLHITWISFLSWRRVIAFLRVSNRTRNRGDYESDFQRLNRQSSRSWSIACLLVIVRISDNKTENCRWKFTAAKWSVWKQRGKSCAAASPTEQSFDSRQLLPLSSLKQNLRCCLTVLHVIGVHIRKI